MGQEKRRLEEGPPTGNDLFVKDGEWDSDQIQYSGLADFLMDVGNVDYVLQGNESDYHKDLRDGESLLKKVLKWKEDLEEIAVAMEVKLGTHW
jgi:hypothetical protein